MIKAMILATVIATPVPTPNPKCTQACTPQYAQGRQCVQYCYPNCKGCQVMCETRCY